MFLVDFLEFDVNRDELMLLFLDDDRLELDNDFFSLLLSVIAYLLVNN